jgi:parallel beta-helix repeat protein
MRTHLLSKKTSAILILSGFLFLSSIVSAQSELLYLKFEDNLNGEDGEIPTFYDINFPVTYQFGLDGKAAFFPEFNQVKYSEDNIAELEGSMAYWIKPAWESALDHRIFRYGGTGGMLFGTDGGGYYVSLINVAMGAGELYANFNANNWQNDQWYFVVHTWNKFAPTNQEALQVYVNGVKVAQNDPNRDKSNIHLIDDNEFQIGGEGSSSSLEAFVDNYMILDYQLTDAQVIELYNSLDPPSDLVLEFENNLLGFNGEEPSFYNSTYPVTYEPATFGFGGHFPDNNELRYYSEDNINDTLGTIAVWLKPDWEGNDNQSHTLFSYGESAGMFFGKSATNHLQCFINKGTGADELMVSYDISNWNDGIWYHIACTWDKNASTNPEALKLFINGELVDQNDPSVPASNIHFISDDEFQIGGHPADGSINAILDRFIIRDNVLTNEEIMQLFAEYIPPQTFSEIYLEFEGHLNGACGEEPYEYNPAYPITFVSGYAGQAAFFPTGNTLKYESSNNLNGLSGTLSYFIKPSWSGNADNHNILVFGDNEGIWIGTDNSGNLQTILNYNGSEQLSASFDVSGWNDSEWYHVVHVWDHEANSSSEAIQVYVDGVLVAQNSSGYPPSAIQPTTAEVFQLGGDDANHSLNAALDRCFILGYPVTETEAIGLSTGQIPVIKGMNLEGNMSYTLLYKNYNIGVAENESVIKIHGVSNILLDGNEVQSHGEAYKGYFIDIQDASMIEVSDFDTLSSYFYAVNVDNSNNVSISNNNFSNNKMDQIGWIHIWHDIDNALGGGVLIHNSRKVDIQENTMQFQNDGVAMYSCDSIQVQNNNLSWNTGYGIRMFHSDSCTIVNNDCSHANRTTDPSDCAAILLFFSRENYVVDNDFSYGGDGIFTNENKTMGNSIPNFLPSNNYFANNDCSWSPHNAIESVFTDGNIFENNICDYSNYGLWLGYSYDLEVIGNQINNNSASGIAIDRGFDNIIVGNEIKNNNTGLDLWEGGGTGLPGYTNQTSHDYLVDGNIFEANGRAIKSEYTEYALIQNNTFAYNYTDIYIEDNPVVDTITANVFGNAVYSYINNQSITNIFAEQNTFPDDTDLVDCKIFDQNDDPYLGLVDYQPFFPSAVEFEMEPPGDLVEPNTSFWTIFVEDGMPTTMTWDTEDKQVGDASIHVVTESGYDVIPHYWPEGGKMADWTLTEEDTLQFWLKTINPHSLQFQQFYIRLGNNCNAYYQFTTPLSNINSTIGNWVKFDVPLAGNTTWTRTSNGEVSFSEIAYFEFNLDTWDWGFEFWIDGVTLNNYLGVGLHEPAKYPEQYYCYPNPFSTQADIRLFLPESGTIELCIYNLHGLKLKEILNQQLTAGRHQIPVDTSNIPPGIYLLELKTTKHKQVKRIIRR